MKHVLNVLRFLLYLPLCYGALLLMYYLMGLFLGWIVELSWFWLIVAGSMIVFSALGAGMYLFGFLGGLISMVNPYKKIGGWIVVPVAVLMGLFQLFFIWKVANLEHSRQLVAALIGTVLTLYMTIIFSTSVSLANARKTFRELQ